MDFRLILGFLALLFAVLPLIFLCCFKNEKHLKIAFLVLFILYTIIVCFGVFTNISLSKVIQIYPYEKPIATKNFNFSFITKNKQDIFINIFMLIPFGFLLCPFFKKHKILFTTLVGFGFSCLIEVLRLVLPVARFAQLTDIILNTISCLIGALLFALFNFIKNKVKN